MWSHPSALEESTNTQCVRDPDRSVTGFARAAIRGENVIVDLSDCEFIDSTAISMLLHTETIVARDGGRLVVALPAVENPVTRVAEVIKLAELLPTYASFDAALASFHSAEAADAQPV